MNTTPTTPTAPAAKPAAAASAASAKEAPTGEAPAAPAENAAAENAESAENADQAASAAAIEAAFQRGYLKGLNEKVAAALRRPDAGEMAYPDGQHGEPVAPDPFFLPDAYSVWD